jgi:L-ascorbate metabolism protein UlaG (beta-lactamase superfamily)
MKGKREIVTLTRLFEVARMPTTFRYLGISAFEIEAKGCRILVDPCITRNPLCPIKVEDIEGIDVILITHGAPDHMGDAVEIQKRTGATLVSALGVRVHALRHGVREEETVSILWGDLIDVKGVKIQGVECRHISFFQSAGTYISDLPLSFIIYPEEGTRIYNLGDTALFSDMKLIAELYRPNVALVPIGGSPKLTGGWTHLAPREAALAVQWIGPEVVIPTHFDPQLAEAESFAERARSLSPIVKVVALKPGETFTFNPRID